MVDEKYRLTDGEMRWEINGFGDDLLFVFFEKEAV